MWLYKKPDNSHLRYQFSTAYTIMLRHELCHMMYNKIHV